MAAVVVVAGVTTFQTFPSKHVSCELKILAELTLTLLINWQVDHLAREITYPGRSPIQGDHLSSEIT